MVVTGVLTAGLALILYLFFGTDGSQNQTPATADHERGRPGEQHSGAPQTVVPQATAPLRTPPPTVTEQAPMVPSPPVASERAPVSHVHHSRTNATQHFRSQADSRVAQEPASQTTGGTAPSINEQNSQPTQSRSDLATQNEPAQTSTALQPPSSPSPSSLAIQPVVAPFAMLHATGKILLNGKLSDDSVISSGESIETPPDTYATVVRDKSEVLIKPSSRLKINDGGVELESGEVLITTSNGLPVETNRLTITPSTDSRTKYEVLDTSESPQVKTFEGSVLVKDGK